MKLKNVIYILCAFIWVIGCHSEKEKGPEQKKVEGYPITIKDASQKEVIVNYPPERIVVAGTSLYSEILVDLKQEKKIVALAESANTPEVLSQVPSIGKSLQPNLEIILATKPDIVFGISEGHREKIESAGIPVFVIGKPPYGIIDSLGELFLSIKNIDLATSGNTERARQLIQEIEQNLEKLQQQIPPKEPIRAAIVYLSPKNPPYAIGKNTLENELLIKANIQNVFDNTGPISIEEFIKQDPDIIITDPSQLVNLYDEDAWHKMKAVKNKQVFGINASHWSSSHIAKTFAILVKQVYPEVFK